MIQKIDIENFGSYNGYVWDNIIRNNYLYKNVNIIYGRNYSGKTTLSRIYKCVEDKKLHNDFDDQKFRIYFENGTVVTEDNIGEKDINIHVYNTDFVKQHLNWLYNEDGTIEPFAVLGSENVEIEKEINELFNRLGDDPSIETVDSQKKGLLCKHKELEDSYKTASSERDRLQKDLDGRLRKKANEDIKRNTLYNDPNYDIRKIKNDIEAIKNNQIEELDEDTEEKYKKLLKEDIKNDISKLSEEKPHFEKYFSRTKELLSKMIKPTVPIQELLNDAILAEWVRQGRELHEDKRDICAFCGNPISKELWDKLDNHFNSESEALRVDIKRYIDLLENAKNSLENFINFNEENFYSTYQSEIKSLIDDWKNLKKQYEKNIQVLIDGLRKKEENIFQVIDIVEVEDVSFKIYELIKNINKLIDDNNYQTKTLKDDKDSARSKLKLNQVYKFIKDINYYKKLEEIKQANKKQEELKKEKESLENEIKEIKRKIKKLEILRKDESRGAELVNEYLAKKFGTGSFKLISLEDHQKGVKYKIVRDGVDAKNLSEGECSLISFCYFMAKISDELKINENDLILYIDDPISSLDSNHIFFVFSLIESIIVKPKKFKQLFISTHNLDFLKYLKRLSAPESNKEYFLIEIEQKQNLRRSTIKLMPDHFKKYITEFNYLFSEIYKLYKHVNGDRAQQINNTYNQFYNIPNIIRKFLEYYLFYKYPNSNTPLNNLNKLFDDNIPPLLNRVVNELSHLTFIDRGWNPLDIPEVEECVKIVIEKIREKDPDQFDALKSSIGVT